VSQNRFKKIEKKKFESIYREKFQNDPITQIRKAETFLFRTRFKPPLSISNKIFFFWNISAKTAVSLNFGFNLCQIRFKVL